MKVFNKNDFAIVHRPLGSVCDLIKLELRLRFRPLHETYIASYSVDENMYGDVFFKADPEGDIKVRQRYEWWILDITELGLVFDIRGGAKSVMMNPDGTIIIKDLLRGLA